MMLIVLAKMPDKRYAKGCGSSCLRCWQNRLKHANPTVKKYMKKHQIDSIHTDEYNKTLLELKLKNLERNGMMDSSEYLETQLQLKLENQKKAGPIHTDEYNRMLSRLRMEAKMEKQKHNHNQSNDDEISFDSENE